MDYSFLYVDNRIEVYNSYLLANKVASNAY